MNEPSMNISWGDSESPYNAPQTHIMQIAHVTAQPCSQTGAGASDDDEVAKISSSEPMGAYIKSETACEPSNSPHSLNEVLDIKPAVAVPEIKEEEDKSQIFVPEEAPVNEEIEAPAHEPEIRHSPTEELLQERQKKPRKPACKRPRNAKEAFKFKYAPAASGKKTPKLRLVKLNGSGTTSKKRKREAVSETGVGVIQQFANYNPIAAHHAQEDYEPAPSFEASTKKAQIENLYKNLPNFCDTQKARGEIKALDEATSYFGHRQLQAHHGKWLLKGMKSALYGYQVIGVTWMLNREFSLDDPKGPHGGILADAMGLGRTLETLAVMVANPPGKEVPRNQRSTLIVVPANIKDQWRIEIDTHADSETIFPRVMTYKAAGPILRIFYEDCDIVVATWDDLPRSCPFPDKETFNRLKSKDRGKKGKTGEDESSPIQKWIEDHRNEGENLHQIQWYRIILDEAHKLKNHLSRTSLAACSLLGQYRWALSGTPVMNRLEEFYPYFRFLNLKCANPSYRIFKGEYCDPQDPVCTDRMDGVLAKIMCRRTMQDKFLGRPLVILPKPHEWVKEFDFGAEETILYRAFEDRMRELINTHLAKSDELKKLTCFLAQLTRLRQFIAHPMLAERQLKLALTIEQLERIKIALKNLPSVDHTIYDRVCKWIKEKRDQSGQSVDPEKPENTIQCMICQDEAQEPVFINKRNCKHVYCSLCIDLDVDAQVGHGLDEPLCPKCKTSFDGAHDLKPLTATSGKGASSDVPRIPKKGKDWLGFHPKTPQSDWLDKFDAGNIEVFDSAKLKACVDQVDQWLKGTESEKFIVFTQWRPFAAILGRAFQKKGVNFVYFSGDKSADKRGIVIKKFEEESSIRVMVAGLHCGGVGLNLAFASRVINIDLWWNTCVEQQAFSRVYRIGQRHETHFVRLIISNSVDQRLYNLQQKKLAIIDPTMKTELTLEEAAGLFGRVIKDAKGNMRVERDYDDEDEYNQNDNNSDSDDDYSED